VPAFALGTDTDHVDPWLSVHKAHLYFDADVTFVLTKGGHNSGVISPPGHSRRSFRILTTGAHDAYLDADDWRAKAHAHDGSWWPAWGDWLVTLSSWTPPEQLNKQHKRPLSLGAAPGSYVFQN